MALCIELPLTILEIKEHLYRCNSENKIPLTVTHHAVQKVKTKLLFNSRLVPPLSMKLEILGKTALDSSFCERLGVWFRFVGKTKTNVRRNASILRIPAIRLGCPPTNHDCVMTTSALVCSTYYTVSI